MKPSGKALIVIDVQNDYFPGGKLPLWNADETLSHIVNAIADAGKRGIPVILVKHAADQAKGAGFFIPGTTGADIHPDILKAAPDAPVIIKHRADAFNGTNLNAVLDKSGIEKILICGMQTQNCVGLTAISKTPGATKRRSCRIAVLPKRKRYTRSPCRASETSFPSLAAPWHSADFCR